MINMFDIKNLSIIDYIIGGLVIIICFLIYKYYVNSNKIKLLDDEINDLNDKITKLNKQITNNSETNNDSESESNDNSEITCTKDDDTINYKTVKTLETFNNTKQTNVKQNIECDENFCYINKPLEEKMNNLSKEVDNIIKSDVYIPIDLKQIINNVYDFQEIDEDYEIEDDDEVENEVYKENNDNFNPIIINNEIKITQDDIDKNKIIQIPDFINIPIEIGQGLKESFKNIDLESSIDDKINKNNITNDLSSQVEINLEEKINLDNNSSEEKIGLEEQEKNLEEQEKNIVKDTDISLKESNEKIQNMKINDIKNLAKEFNIQITKNGKPKNKDQLVKEIKDYKNKTSNI